MKTRIILVGGFLGSGKTTLLLRASQRLIADGYRVGLITNDQGHGLVDTALAQQTTIPVTEVAGGCFCCRFPDLLESISRLQAQVSPDIVVAEPVGSCTDLVSTVVRPLNAYYPDQFDIAPLTVLVNPRRELELFPASVTYLYEKQLAEAEVIVLNKADLLSQDEIERSVENLAHSNPHASVMSLSARTGQGVADWLHLCLQTTSATKQTLDLDYAIYAEAEAYLGWLNLGGNLAARTPFLPKDWIAHTLALLERRFSEDKFAIAHMKLFLETPTASFKASITRSGEPIGWDLDTATTPVDRARLTLNVRANAAPARLESLVQQGLKDAGQRFNTELEIGHFECFSPLPPRPSYRLSADAV
jgi:G3E family GTPase